MPKPKNPTEAKQRHSCKLSCLRAMSTAERGADIAARRGGKGFRNLSHQICGARTSGFQGSGFDGFGVFLRSLEDLRRACENLGLRVKSSTGPKP